ncbi:MAG: hypothetical protein NTX03_09540, partial [Bacteroidetes bacterium]|nr:hypothetical protein [Bacteroidota bacterium]
MKNKLLQTIKTSAIAMMFLLLFAGSAFAQLGGTYTVNASASASATNYQDVTSVVEDLTGGTRSDGGTANGPGVKSAVLINIASDTYYGKYDITPISGASATNSITFTSAAADSSKVILADTSYYNYTYNYVVRLNGADFITFKKVTILRRFPKSSTYNYYGNVIVIKNNA